MNKIKFQNKGNIITIDFYTDLLQENKLYKFCNLFNFKFLYLNIFMVNINKGDLYKTLIEKKIASEIFCVSRNNLQDIYLKVTTNNLGKIVPLLKSYDFDEIEVWDCYVNWELHLKDFTKPSSFFTIKKSKDKSKSKFFLDFNLVENNKVQVICDCDYEKYILEEIHKIID